MLLEKWIPHGPFASGEKSLGRAPRFGMCRPNLRILLRITKLKHAGHGICSVLTNVKIKQIERLRLALQLG